MKYSSKLKILSVVTIVGLGLIFFVTLFGLNNMRDTEATAHRRQAYVADLLEIKSSALSTILLDPTDATSKEIFNAAEKNIAQHGEIAVGVIRREDVKVELKNILALWGRYLEESKKVFAVATTDPAKANANLQPLYNDKFKPFQAALEKFIAVRQTEAAQGVAKSKEMSEETFWEIIGLIVLVAVVNVVAVVSLSISLGSQLAGILEKLIPLKRGDLTQRIPIKEDNELGDIAANINEFVQELQTIVQNTRIRS
jgi:methyl-accepting chemotaxis protein